MAINKKKKQEIVASFTAALKDSQSVVFVNFHKLTVAQSSMLRRALRAEGVGYYVGKKTLLKRALADRGYTGELPSLDGEVAIAYGADLLSPARVVYEFQKQNKDTISLLGGIFEGTYKNKEEMTAIATIPPLQTLRGMFVNIINSPIQRFVIALDQIAKK
jgi:large subunit ribosomal protein L10